MFSLADILQLALVGGRGGRRVDDPLSCIFAILSMMLSENWLNFFFTKRVKFLAIFSKPADHKQPRHQGFSAALLFMPVLLGLKFDSILLVKGLSVLLADFMTLIYGTYGTPFLFANMNGLKKLHTWVI